MRPKLIRTQKTLNTGMASSVHKCFPKHIQAKENPHVAAKVTFTHDVTPMV